MQLKKECNEPDSVNEEILTISGKVVQVHEKILRSWLSFSDLTLSPEPTLMSHCNGFVLELLCKQISQCFPGKKHNLIKEKNVTKQRQHIHNFSRVLIYKGSFVNVIVM